MHFSLNSIRNVLHNDGQHYAVSPTAERAASHKNAFDSVAAFNVPAVLSSLLIWSHWICGSVFDLIKETLTTALNFKFVNGASQGDVTINNNT